MTNPTSTALILGATGTIGAEVGRKLLERGWKVRALHRNPASLRNTGTGFDWRQGDAMKRADVMAAAQGVELIMHAVNPPGYHNWGGLVLPMIDNTIAAAKANHARILLPGTVYNFGENAFPILREDSPQHPHTRKGKIRVELERRLHAASEDGAAVLIVRAGDFFGPGSSANSWFASALVKPGQPISSIQYPGTPGVGHQWAYVPDVAETMVRLIERRDSLPAFASYHMLGHWDEDGSRMIETIRQASGKPDLKVVKLPWWALRFVAPFNETVRELLEMRYLWQHSLRMDNARLKAMLGEEPHTPWDTAIKTTLRDLRLV